MPSRRQGLSLQVCVSADWRDSAIGRALLALGSIWLGVGLIVLIVVYLSLTSTLPVTIAGALGIGLFSASDPVELYRWRPFVAACLALCGNLALATVLRVPLRLRHAGAWITHAGVIVLAAGALWYAQRSVSGDSASVRTRDGWTPIRHVYHKHSFGAYVTPGGKDEAIWTDLGRLLPHGEPRALDVPIDSGLEGVEIRATRFFPRAQVVSRWEEASPNKVPAVELRITDGGEARTAVLSPSLPGSRQFGGRDYVLVYHTGLTPEALAKMIAPAGRDAGPGMPHDLALIVTGRRIEPTLVVVRPDGGRWHRKLAAGTVLDVPLAGRTVRVEAVRFFQHAARLYEIAKPGDAQAGPEGPVLRIELRAGTFERTTHVLFSAYQHLGPPQLVDLPDQRAVWLGFSRARTALPATLQLLRAEYQTWPGSQIPKDYLCAVEVTAGGERRAETLNLNHPVQVGPFQFSQGSWHEDPHQPMQILLLAATRPGLGVIWAGCAMICLGFPLAFYLKPLLASRRRTR